MNLFKLYLPAFLLVFSSGMICQVLLDDFEITNPQPLPELTKTNVLGSGGVPYSNPYILVIDSDMENLTYGPKNLVLRIERENGLDTLYLVRGTRAITINRAEFLPFTFKPIDAGIYFGQTPAWKIHLTGIITKQVFNITVATAPSDATIYLDDKKMPPGGKEAVKEGRHQVKVVKAGFETAEQDINVNRDTTDFYIALKVNVRFKTDPEDALVYYKDELLPRKNIALVPPGPHNFKVERDGYSPRLIMIEVPEKDTLVTVELIPEKVIYRRGISFVNFRLPSLYIDFAPPPIGEYRINNAYGLGVSFDLHIGGLIKIKRLFLSTAANIALGSFHFIDRPLEESLESGTYFPVQINAGLIQKIRFNNAMLAFSGGYNFKSMNFDDGLISNFNINGYYTAIALEIPTREHTDMGIELVYNFLSYKDTVMNGQLVPLETKEDASHFSFRFYLGILP